MEMVKLSCRLATNAKFISDLSMPPIHYQRNILWAVCGQISVSSHFWQCHASNYIDYLNSTIMVAMTMTVAWKCTA